AKRRALAQIATSLLPLARQVEQPLVLRLLGERALRREGDDLEVLVRLGEQVARVERFAMEHAGVDEYDVEPEAEGVGHVAKDRAGALHAGQDRGPWAERRGRPGQDLGGRSGFESLVDGFEIAAVEAHAY